MRILVAITEDWFALSHFVPLLTELASIADDVVVATRSSGRLPEIRRLGVRTRHFDMQRGSLSPPSLLHVRDGLARLNDEERPDVVHVIGMQAAVMTSLALSKAAHRPTAVILHLTGLGYLGQSRSPVAYVLRPLARAALRRCVLNHGAWVVGENDEDVSRMIADRVSVSERTSVLPGAGIDTDQFPELPAPLNPVPRVAFVGRMLLSKGLDVLIEAHRMLLAGGLRFELALYGATDWSSCQAIPQQRLLNWGKLPGLTLHGFTKDIAGVWRHAHIAVVPSLGGEGMPRAMLEAGACGRPLVVSDIPGCREFVRHGVEGYLVPPGDPGALAAALGRLASDPRLRLQAGAAARQRIVEGFAEHVVRARIRRLYESALHPGGTRPIAPDVDVTSPAGPELAVLAT